MKSDERFWVNSDDSEARSVAHKEFGEEAEEDGANLFVLMIGRSRSLAHG